MEKIILIIDDDQIAIKTLSKLLINFDYTVLSTTEPTTAFDYLKNNNINIVICDYRIPYSNGINLLDKIKAVYSNIISFLSCGFNDPLIEIPIKHRIIFKPWEEKSILKNIDRAFLFIEIRNNPDYKTINLANESSGILITDLDNNIIFINSIVTTLTNYEEKELLGKNIKIFNIDKENIKRLNLAKYAITKKGYWYGNLTINNKFKNNQINIFSILPFKYKNSSCYIYLIEGESKEHIKYKTLEYQAYYNPEIGLPNQFNFRKTIASSILSAKNLQEIGIIIIELNQFIEAAKKMFPASKVNQLIKAVADQLIQHTRTLDFISFFNNRFSVLVVNNKDELNVSKVTENIVNSLNKTYLIEDHELKLFGNFAACTYPYDAKSDYELILMANKILEMGNHEAYNEKKREEKYIFDKSSLIHYQIIYDNETDTPFGIRVIISPKDMKQSDLKSIKINEFINDISSTIFDKHLFEILCNDLSNLEINGLSIHKLGMIMLNVKNMDKSTLKNLKLLLRKFNLNPSSIFLLISEDLLSANYEFWLKTSKSLNRLGINLIIDNYGQTNLATINIHKLCFHGMHINSSYFNEEANESNSAKIAPIITMAESLGLKIFTSTNKNVIQQLYHYTNNSIQHYWFSEPALSNEMIENISIFKK